MWCKLLPLLHGFSLIMLYLKKYLFPICQWRYFSVTFYNFYHYAIHNYNYAAKSAAKSLQSCPTLCDPIDGSPPGPTVPGILQARTLEWVAISSSHAWKWKVKVKSLSRVWLLATHGLQPTRLLRPRDFPGKSTGVVCHCLLPLKYQMSTVCLFLRHNEDVDGCRMLTATSGVVAS